MNEMSRMSLRRRVRTCEGQVESDVAMGCSTPAALLCLTAKTWDLHTEVPHEGCAEEAGFELGGVGGMTTCRSFWTMLGRESRNCRPGQVGSKCGELGFLFLPQSRSPTSTAPVSWAGPGRGVQVRRRPPRVGPSLLVGLGESANPLRALRGDSTVMVLLGAAWRCETTVKRATLLGGFSVEEVVDDGRCDRCEKPPSQRSHHAVAPGHPRPADLGLGAHRTEAVRALESGGVRRPQMGELVQILYLYR